MNDIYHFIFGGSIINNVSDFEQECEKSNDILIVLSRLSADFDMNAVCTTGPLFCYVIDRTKSVSVIKIMVERGLDFGHVHTQGVAHNKVFRELEFNYSDNLWGLFVYLCQHTNFVQSLPFDEMFDIFFGKIVIENGNITFEFEMDLMVFKILLAYDTHHNIKKSYFQMKNSSLRECVKQKIPHLSNLIINN